MICACESMAIIDAEIYDDVVAKFKEYHVVFLNNQEKLKLEKYMFPNGVLNPLVVGKDAEFIAKEAGIKVPEGTKVLAVDCKTIGEKELMSKEKLAPVIGMLKVKDSKEGLEMAKRLVEFDGLGHSAAIHTRNQELAVEFGKVVPVIRVIWNSPSTFGGIGNVYNEFIPSLTLGCGSYGHNSVGDNVSAFTYLILRKWKKKQQYAVV